MPELSLFSLTKEFSPMYCCFYATDLFCEKFKSQSRHWLKKTLFLSLGVNALIMY